MPDKTDRTYLLKTLSLCLISDNFLEEIYVWVGDGSNGKGILRDMILYTFGEYFDNMNVKYLEKTKSTELSKISKKNSGIVISIQADGNVNLKCEKLKQILDRLPIKVKECDKSTYNFIPKFKLILQTNKIVNIDNYDSVVSKRLRFILFPNKFVDDPKFPHERKIDRSAKERIKDEKYRLAFFQILLNHYYDFVKNDNNKLEMTERIKNDTANYLQNNDYPLEFNNL